MSLTRTEAEAAVKAAYQSVLERDADPQGLELAVQHIIEGSTTVEDLKRGMLESDEYKKKNFYKTHAATFKQFAQRRLLGQLFTDYQAKVLF